MPSEDRSVTIGASGHSDLQQVPLSASARKRSGPERLATPKSMLRTARSAVPCRVSASGHRTISSEHPRGQSRESLIRSEDWFVTIDLKDAYFHISILHQHRKFLRFAFRGKAYQYRVLPFGLALSPRTFTKCVDAALAPLRLQGICILNYIDDWLILAQSEILAVRHRDVVLI